MNIWIDEREGGKGREREGEKEGRKSVVEEMWSPPHLPGGRGGPGGLGRPLEGAISPDLVCQASRCPCALPENAPGNVGHSWPRRSLNIAPTGVVVRSFGCSTCSSTQVGGGVRGLQSDYNVQPLKVVPFPPLLDGKH